MPPICISAPAGVWEAQNHSRRPQAGQAGTGRWTAYKTPGRYFRNDGYYLGLGLTRATGVPVGIVGLGASALESMTPPEGFAAFEEELGPPAARVATWLPRTPRGRQAYLKTLAEIDAWVGRTRATLQRSGITHADFPQPPLLPGPPALEAGPTTMYNFVIHRFTPAAVRGILIQPKVNNLGDRQYLLKAKALICGLRRAFGRDDLPVCFLQMHTPDRGERQATEDPDDWVRLRDAQNRLAALPHTTVVATYDLKGPGRSEPDLGLRAAQWAAALVADAPVLTGPTYRTHRLDGESILVEFDQVGKGLMVGEAKAGRPVQPAADRPPRGFQVAGRDGQWHDAAAAIRGKAVVVTCPKVPKCVSVRYAWAPEPTAANLYNRAGFPALPFAAADLRRLDERPAGG